eukprot:CAMPEP_0182470500 /NCGR_PEP_ID=MMETSP1319-20130603/18811_1 /TAXON_ID=172717 /ORGANISM="Bolidomonas pacifica, Strain RCC208" /LENGTH=113 /DNA_ID=CAMNT_0024670949 /DNA_START=40 /DNA_END=378 /DNA_ORIENTATION=+
MGSGWNLGWGAWSSASSGWLSLAEGWPYCPYSSSWPLGVVPKLGLKSIKPLEFSPPLLLVLFCNWSGSLVLNSLNARISFSRCRSLSICSSRSACSCRSFSSLARLFSAFEFL